MSAWVIQDGNYPDFAVGQRAEFALEFYAAEQLRPGRGPGTAVSLGDARYEISATVTTVREDAWVIDFGIQAYRESPPAPDIEVGSDVAGIVYVGIDPFSYFERLAHVPDMPPLVYTWDILDIRRIMAPSKESEVSAAGEPLRFEHLSSTDAWHDDNYGVAEYVFDCQLVDVPPKRTSSTRR
jgi:hypothetical protein